MRRLLLGTGLTLGLVGAAAAEAPAVPAPAAREVALLPGGGWLAVDRQAVRLVDAQGRERDRLELRGQHLDIRPHAQGALAVLLDANTQQVQRVVVELASMQLRALEALPAPAFPVETLCIGRDDQLLDHLWLVGKDGITEHHVMAADAPAAQARLLRRLALPPQVKHCRVDDLTQTLYVAEPGFGVWAYPADAEAAPQRRPVLLLRPYGPLRGGPGAFAGLPGGVAVAAADGSEVLLLQGRAQTGWRTAKKLDVPAGRRVQAMAVEPRGERLRLAFHDGKQGRWWWQEASWLAVAAERSVAVVMPRVQTAPVARFGDAADDPAIWVHPTDPARSRVLGTNKKQGLLVYDLHGREVQLLEVGRLNNVDVRQDVRLGAQSLDLAAATHRDDLDVVLFTIDAEGSLREAGRIRTGLPDIYGLCLHRPRDGGAQVFVNDKDGRFLQFEVTTQADGKLGGRLVRQFKVASQPEGCVADDAAERLFLGEEKRGVWTVSARADAPARLQLVLGVGPQLRADVEGMGLYQAGAANYLVVSSQGNSRFVVLDAQPPFAVRGTFRIGLNLEAGIDGVSDTDGLEVTSANLGGPFARGMLVVQDGYKRLPDGPQNFKYVAWDDIARVLKLP